MLHMFSVCVGFSAIKKKSNLSVAAVKFQNVKTKNCVYGHESHDSYKTGNANI